MGDASRAHPNVRPPRQEVAKIRRSGSASRAPAQPEGAPDREASAVPCDSLSVDVAHDEKEPQLCE